MNLLRVAGRTLLASYFVVNGAKSVANPQPLVEDAQPLVDKAVPMIKSVTPASVLPYVPESAATMIRLNGAMQILGGFSLATGIGRRLGASMLTLAMVPHVLASNPLKGSSAEAKADNRKTAIRNAALLGGVMLASQDLEGKPSLTWRAEQQQKRLQHQAEKTGRQLRRETKDAKKAAKLSARKLRRAAHKHAARVSDKVSDIIPS